MPSDVMPPDENFLSFDEIFEELNYRQAQRTLRDIVANLDLSERERRGLEDELEELQQMLDKLERQVLQIAVFQNDEGLEQLGGNVYGETANSGTPIQNPVY